MIKKFIYPVYLIIFLVVLSGCGSETKINYPSSSKIKINCPNGYTATHVPYPTFESDSAYYCKINKKWTDFKKCSSEKECNESESCISSDGSEGDGYTRCVPTEHYKMPCWCNINHECVCI
jgi:hypothetical protein